MYAFHLVATYKTKVPKLGYHHASAKEVPLRGRVMVKAAK